MEERSEQERVEWRGEVEERTLEERGGKTGGEEARWNENHPIFEAEGHRYYINIKYFYIYTLNCVGPQLNLSEFSVIADDNKMLNESSACSDVTVHSVAEQSQESRVRIPPHLLTQ